MSQKRSAEETGESVRKYMRIRLASPSPERSGGSDTESIHSCQGYETELAKDTSDTSSSPFYNIEYEVTDTEKEKFYLSDDSDEDDDQLGPNIYTDLSIDSADKALLGDTSEENPTSPTSNSDADPGLPRSDYLDFEKCLLCHTDRKDISYPYCSTCFAWRKNLFPSRPKKNRKVTKKDQTQTTDSSKPKETSYPEILKLKSNCVGGVPLKKENDSSEDKVNDSGVGSSGPQLSQDAESSQMTQVVKSQSSEDVIEGSQSTKDVSSSQLSEDVVEGPCPSTAERSQISQDVVEGPSKERSQPPSFSTPSTSASDSASSSRKLSLDMCRVCFLRPENGLFIHLNIAHVYGCYSCAKKIWYHNGGCPICRRKIFKVAKLFV